MYTAGTIDEQEILNLSMSDKLNLKCNSDYMNFRSVRLFTTLPTSNFILSYNISNFFFVSFCLPLSLSLFLCLPLPLPFSLCIAPDLGFWGLHTENLSTNISHNQLFIHWHGKAIKNWLHFLSPIALKHPLDLWQTWTNLYFRGLQFQGKMWCCISLEEFI